MQDMDLLGRLDQLVNQGESCIEQANKNGNWQETATWFIKEFKVLEIQAFGLQQSSLSDRIKSVHSKAKALGAIIKLY